MGNVIEEHPYLIIGGTIFAGLAVYAIREGKSIADIFGSARVVAPNMAGGTVSQEQYQYATDEEVTSAIAELRKDFEIQHPPPATGGGSSVEEQSVDIWARGSMGDAGAVGW